MAKAKKRLSAEERKKQILRCSVRVFARSSYRAATVAGIAAEAGISEALIYRHFPSKKSLLLHMLQRTSERIVLLWQNEVDKEQDALKALRNMGRTYYKRMVKHPDELRVQFQAISEINDKAVARRLQLDHQAYMTFIGEVLRKGIRQGSVRRTAHVDTLATLLNGVGILMNMMRLLSFGERLTEKTVARMIDHIIDSITA